MIAPLKRLQLSVSYPPQNDLVETKARREELSRAKEGLQGQVAELGGLVKSLESQLAFERVRWGELGGMEGR